MNRILVSMLVGLSISSLLVVGTNSARAAEVKEIVVEAGDTGLSYCPVIVTSETPIAAGAFKSLKMPDRKGKITVQIREMEKGSELSFIVPDLAANSTLRLTPSEESVSVSPVVVRIAATDRVDIRIGDKLLTSYWYPDDSEKPYLYPVIGPNGARLTRGYPMEDLPYEEGAKDHPHHRSLWVAHGDINGANFWHMAKDKQKTEEVLVTSPGPVYGRLVARNSWVNSEGKRIISEQREYTFYNTPGQARLIDSVVTFTATDGDATFHDTKEGGICAIRLNPKIDERHGTGVMRNSEGGRGASECWGKRAKWCDYYGKLDGQVVGVAVFDHPSNLRHPTWWHIRDYGLYTANCFGLHNFDRRLRNNEHAGDYVLKAGRSLTFRYRLLLHAGDTEQARVAEHYAAFASPPHVRIVWAD